MEAGDERLGIGCERRPGIDVAILGAAALRVIALHVHEQPAILVRREVADLQPFASVIANGVDQPASIGTRHRAKCAVGLARAHERFSTLAIELADLILAEPSRIASPEQLAMMLLLVALLLGLGRPCAREERARHVATDVDPDVP